LAHSLPRQFSQVTVGITITVGIITTTVGITIIIGIVGGTMVIAAGGSQ